MHIHIRKLTLGLTILSGLFIGTLVQAEQQIKTFTAEEFNFGQAKESTTCLAAKKKAQDFAQNSYLFQSELGQDAIRVGIQSIGNCSCERVVSQSKVPGWNCSVDAYLNVERE